MVSFSEYKTEIKITKKYYKQKKELCYYNIDAPKRKYQQKVAFY